MLRWAGIWLLLCGLGSAQQELVPGLVGNYRDSQRSVQLVVPSPNFYLEAGESLHPALAPEFVSEWTGWISILRRGAYSFRGADVMVAGRAVGEPGEMLDPGRHPIRLRYRREAGPAALRLEWTAEHFNWEPVPTDRFFHDPAELHGQATLVEEGRRLAEDLGCANCHDPRSSSLRARLGPSLLGIGSRRKRAWLYHWLRDAAGFRSDALMPDNLASDQERRDVAAYLAVQVSQATVKDIGKIARRDQETGRSLLNSLGCGACHQRDSLALNGLGSKTDAATLAAYLADPSRHDASGEMPSFDLTQQEAKELAGALVASTNEAYEVEFTGGDAARGAELVRSARCGACHEMATEVEQPPPAAMQGLRTGRGCLSDEPPGRVPRFRLSPEWRRALTAFVEAYGTAPDISPAPVYDFSRQLTQLRCTTCHALDSAKPTRAIPETGPPLTGLGWRMTEEWLERVLVDGHRSREEIELRMPHYEKARVRQLVAGFARAAGVAPDAEAASAKVKPSMSRLGVNMLGTNAAQGGLGCIGCHGFGEHDALGEEGPALTGLAEKVRQDWFRRWMRDPARILSGTSMPNYFSSLSADEARAKIDALWAALSLGDEMPLPEGFEQARGRPGSEALPVPTDKPVVVRFDMPEATPAAIAVGLPGGISFCFDAGESRLRYAWRGGFVDMTGTLFEKRDRETRLTRTADILGEIFYRADGFPFRVGDTKYLPQRRFRGYRLIDGYPEFHYQVEGADVYERIKATESKSGIVRSFRVAKADQPMWLLMTKGPGYSIQSSLPETADGQLRIPPGRDITFSVTIAARTY
jgi:mono/diheme cytochrome c family protein